MPALQSTGSPLFRITKKLESAVDSSSYGGEKQGGEISPALLLFVLPPPPKGAFLPSFYLMGRNLERLYKTRTTALAFVGHGLPQIRVNGGNLTIQ